MTDVVLLPGALETMARKTWTIRSLLRSGDIDPMAAVTSLRMIEDCAPETLRRLASKTIQEVTGAQ